MTAPLLALSLSNTVLKAGALAAFAALVGIAVLSLLVFSQARELKRLREWAGRAPERAAELEQRVSAEAAARAQRTVPPRPGGVVGTPIPRATPVVARAAAPVTGQTQAVAVAAGAAPVAQPAVAGAGGSSAAAPAAAPGAQPNPERPPAATPVAQSAAPVAGQPAFVPTGQSAPAAAAAAAGSPAAADAEQGAKDESASGARSEAGLAAAVAATSTVGRVARGASALTESEQLPAPPAAPAPTPATAAAAARAAAPSGRSPVPPAPGGSTETRPVAPPRPGAAPGVRGVPEQGVAGARAGRVQGPPFLREERSAGRTTALIVGGVALGVAVLVGVLLSLGGGGSSPGKTSAGAASHSASTGHPRGAHRHHAHAVVASPAETRVVVLNGTETNGLAHRISANLQQSGYAQSAALEAHPPSRSTSVVEYAGGHSTEARQVGQTLGISQVQPLESAVTPLVGDATVVVIAGSDQAALGGEASGASSETSGASGEAAQ
jgi:hypothetical protein